MKIYIKNGGIDYIDCDSTEFYEIQDAFSNLQTWIDLADIPSCLGDTIPERLEKFIELKKKGFIITWKKNN